MNAEIDISHVTFTTPRLLLRPWREEDLDDLYAYARVDGVGQMAGWLPHENKEVSAAILKRFIEGKKTFALEYEGKVIGSLGIERYDEEEFPEFQKLQGRSIGYVLAKDYWGRGLMPEAVKRVIDYCFRDLGLDFLLCAHYTFNDRSRRVQEKCGFAHYKLIQDETSYGEKREAWVSLLWNK